MLRKSLFLFHFGIFLISIALEISNYPPRWMEFKILLSGFSGRLGVERSNFEMNLETKIKNKIESLSDTVITTPSILTTYISVSSLAIIITTASSISIDCHFHVLAVI